MAYIETFTLPVNASEESGGNLSIIAAAQGSSGTGITLPTGGSGLLGWLSGIYGKLSGTLSVSGNINATIVGTPTVALANNTVTLNSAQVPLPVAIVSGATPALSDQSIVDSTGTYWLVRDNGITLTYINWSTGVSGTPSAPVSPVGKAAGEQVASMQYNVTGSSGTGYNTGDILEHIVVLNIVSVPVTIVTNTWVNITTNVILSTPPVMTSLTEVDAVTVLGTGTNAIGSVTVSNLPSVQTVTGNVVLTAGTDSIGSVTVSNLPSIQTNYDVTYSVYAPMYYQAIVTTAAQTLSSLIGVSIPAWATVAFIIPENGTIRYRADGGAPTSTIGMPIYQQQVWPIQGAIALSDAQLIAGSTTTVSIEFRG